jgi:hypothetical protein
MLTSMPTRDPSANECKQYMVKYTNPEMRQKHFFTFRSYKYIAKLEDADDVDVIPS